MNISLCSSGGSRISRKTGHFLRRGHQCAMGDFVQDRVWLFQGLPEDKGAMDTKLKTGISWQYQRRKNLSLLFSRYGLMLGIQWWTQNCPHRGGQSLWEGVEVEVHYTVAEIRVEIVCQKEGIRYNSQNVH